MVTDSLGFYHQGINSHNAEHICMYLQLYRVNGKWVTDISGQRNSIDFMCDILISTGTCDGLAMMWQDIYGHSYDQAMVHICIYIYIYMNVCMCHHHQVLVMFVSFHFRELWHKIHIQNMIVGSSMWVSVYGDMLLCQVGLGPHMCITDIASSRGVTILRAPIRYVSW